MSDYLADEISPEEGLQYIPTLKKILLKNKNTFEKYGTESNRDSISWVLSLALLKFENMVSDEARIGFLLGLQGCFLEKNSLRRSRYGQNEVLFTGQELVQSSYNLLEQVNPILIKDIVEFGTRTNIPEIRAVTFLLMALSGNKTK